VISLYFRKVELGTQEFYFSLSFFLVILRFELRTPGRITPPVFDYVSLFILGLGLLIEVADFDRQSASP
jgi:hypothetical protein